MIFNIPNRTFYSIIGLTSLGLILVIISFLKRHPLARILFFLFLAYLAFILYKFFLQDPAAALGLVLMTGAITFLGSVGGIKTPSESLPLFIVAILSAVATIAAVIGLFIVNNHI